MISLLILFVICLLFSAFFSGAEMAFVSVNEFKIREMADHGDPAAKRIVLLKNQPQSFLTSILISNNVINVTATALLTYWFQSQFGIQNEWLVTAVMMPLLVVFGEMVPKDYCRIYGQQVILGWSSLLTFVTKSLHYPVSVILRGMGTFIRFLGVERDKSIFVSETEFRLLIEESAKSGVLEHHERQLIDRILDFERIEISSVMIPLTEIPAMSITSKIGDAKKIARTSNAKMILVYEEIPSLVVGMVYVFDLLFDVNDRDNLKKCLRSPIFLSQNTSLEKAFMTLQQKRQSFAVVTDGDGEVCGVVPIEKLMSI